MALTITTGTLSTSFTSTEVDTNFDDIISYINGGIVNANISASAGIAITKLANQYQEVWLQLVFNSVDYGVWPAAPADPAAPTFNETLDVVPLPGSDSDNPWTVTDVSWASNDTGTASGSFDIRYGAYNGSGVMTGAGTVCTGVAMTFLGASLGNQGRALEGGSVSLTQSSTVRCLYLVSAGQGTVVMDDITVGNTETSWLRVTVALRRQIQA